MIDYTESEKTVVNVDVDVGFDGSADVNEDVDVGCVERKDLAGFENMGHNFEVGVEFAGLDIDEIEKEKYCRGLEADDIGLGNCSLGQEGFYNNCLDPVPDKNFDSYFPFDNHSLNASLIYLGKFPFGDSIGLASVASVDTGQADTPY